MRVVLVVLGTLTGGRSAASRSDRQATAATTGTPPMLEGTATGVTIRAARLSVGDKRRDDYLFETIPDGIAVCEP